MNCKPGDLAVVIDSDIPENLGLFVDVIATDGPEHNDIRLGHPGHIWHCRARGAIKYRSIFGEVAIVKEGPIPDEVLKPIRPQPMGTKTETKQDLEVTA